MRNIKLHESTIDFFELYESLVSQETSYKRAYEKCEQHWIKAYGQRKYSNYNSFKVMKSQWAAYKYYQKVSQ